jgi:hypothetical protein
MIPLEIWETDGKQSLEGYALRIVIKMILYAFALNTTLAG